LAAYPSSGPRSDVIARLRSAGCVFAEDEARLLIEAALTSDELNVMVDRRVSGLPLEHVLGWAQFCGLRIAVDAGVFVPRRRSEFLVEQAVELASSRAATPNRRDTVVVDMCCGSGAVGVAVAQTLSHGLGPVELHACDVDHAAVLCARRNVTGAGGLVHEGDLFEALPTGLRGRVDVLVANAPYIPTDEIGLLPPEARVHEPRVALDGGSDGLGVARRLIAGAPPWLAHNGLLLLETSDRQAPQAAEAVTSAGLAARVARSDELEATVVVGYRSAGV
jgi:release factor glutamine methyltransferase